MPPLPPPPPKSLKRPTLPAPPFHPATEPSHVRRPARPPSDAAQGIGVGSIVSAGIGVVLLPIVFGPLAIILGVIALQMRYRLAWIGVGLGALEVVFIAVKLAEISESLNGL